MHFGVVISSHLKTFVGTWFGSVSQFFSASLVWKMSSAPLSSSSPIFVNFDNRLLNFNLDLNLFKLIKKVITFISPRLFPVIKKSIIDIILESTCSHSWRKPHLWVWLKEFASPIHHLFPIFQHHPQTFKYSILYFSIKQICYFKYFEKPRLIWHHDGKGRSMYIGRRL